MASSSGGMTHAQPRGSKRASRPLPLPGATLANLPEILRALLASDNDARGVAEATLRQLSRDPHVVPSLLAIARSDADANARQMAAVILKRRVIAHWQRLGESTRDAVKQSLLEGVVREPMHLVKRAIADVLGKVAKATFATGSWSELPEFLAQCTQSPEESHRDVAYVVFASLTESIVSQMTAGPNAAHFATLGGLFNNGLGDASAKVRLSALRATLALVSNASGDASGPEMAIVRGLVPGVLAAARRAVAAGEEDHAGVAYEVLDELIESTPAALAGKVPELVAFCVEVASSPSLGTTTRRRALDVVAFLARHKPKALLRAKLVQPLLRALLPLCGEPRDDDLGGEDDDECDPNNEDEAQVQTVAAQLVDLLALNVPAKHVLPEALQFASDAVRSGDPKRRHAAVAALGIVAEGCADGLARVAPTIVPNVVAALSDPSSREVRGAAAFALGQFAEHLRDVEAHHATVLPALLSALPAEPHKTTQEKMMYAMDAWLEQLDDSNVAPYVQPLLEIVFTALDRAATTRPQVREMLLGACASAAAAAGAAMHAHLPALLPRLERCLQASDDAELKCRARALEVLGMLVSASGGKEAMAPYVASAMHAAMAGFELDYGELREYAHGMFAEVVEAYGEEFEAYLPACLAKAAESLDLDDGVLYDSDEDAADRGRGYDDGFESDSDDSDGGGGGGRGERYSVFSGICEEKAAACKAIANYAHHAPRAFTPRLNEFVDRVGRMCDYMHEMVRAQAHLAMARLARCALEAAPPPATESLAVVDAALCATQRACLEDDDREAVATAMEAAAEVLKSVGAAAGGGVAFVIEKGHVAELAAHCLAVLEGRAACQEGEHDELEHATRNGGGGDDDDEEDEDEEAELGQIVLEGVAELLPALVTFAGAASHASFQPHVAALLRRTSVNRPEGQRSVAYATLVEVVRAIGAPAAVIVPMALPGCARELSSAESGGLRRNCAYCAGVLAELCGSAAEASKYLPTLAPALAALLDDEDEERGVKDNAASACVRILTMHQCAAAKDPATGPALLDRTLRALPLREDFEEAAAAYGGLCALLRVDDPEVNVFAPRIVQTFALVATEEAGKAAKRLSAAAATARGAARFVDFVPADALRAMGACVTEMSSARADVHAVLARLPHEQQAALMGLSNVQ